MHRRQNQEGRSSTLCFCNDIHNISIPNDDRKQKQKCLAPHFASYVYFNEMWPSEYNCSTLPMFRFIPSGPDKNHSSQPHTPLSSEFGGRWIYCSQIDWFISGCCIIEKGVLSGTLCINIFIGRRYMAEILPIRRRTLPNQSIIGLLNVWCWY